jgi:prepilin-type N-terminal cleavage/methylation domain-containing protein
LVTGEPGHRVTMKGQNALRRRRASRANRGFTLIELMVVIALIAIIAAIAAPSFSESRNDRIAFDYARQYQQLLLQARSRAAGTGSAHLAVLGPGTNGRGFLRLYAALDGQATPGPSPVSSCKLDPNQWNEAQQEPPTINGTRARFIDWTDLNRPGVNDQMELMTELRNGAGTVGATSTTVKFLAVCITPSGVTYVGDGASEKEAIDAMRGNTQFTGVAEVRVSRSKGGSRVGLLRRLMITGGGSPRLRSE